MDSKPPQKTKITFFFFFFFFFLLQPRADLFTVQCNNDDVSLGRKVGPAFL